MDSPVGPSPRARVLAVCTGNICRSPAVERLLGTWLGPAGIEVSSAGTHAMVGMSMAPEMAELVDGAGGRSAGFLARQLTAELVAGADLVLALTRAHRSAVVELHPPALRTTVSLRELARLAADTDRLAALPSGPVAARLAAARQLALEARGTDRVSAADDDIEDPYRRGDEAYRRSFGQLLPAVHAVLRLAVG